MEFWRGDRGRGGKFVKKPQLLDASRAVPNLRKTANFGFGWGNQKKKGGQENGRYVCN